MKSNFLLIEDECVETSLTLIDSGYSEKPSAIYDEEQSEPLKILINTKDKSFFWLDQEALKETKTLIKIAHKQNIQITNLKILSQWLIQAHK